MSGAVAGFTTVALTGLGESALTRSRSWTVVANWAPIALAISAARTGSRSVTAMSTRTVLGGTVAEMRLARAAVLSVRPSSSMTGSSTIGVVTRSA